MLIPEWRQRGGAGAVVGVCDTGLETSLPCFAGKELVYRTFGTAGRRHGTHVASTIFGIAPQVKMVFAGGIMDSYARLERMLEWMASFHIDVLNLSLAFPARDEAILALIREMNSHGAIVVCARAPGLPFPWSEPEFLSAGPGGDFPAPAEWTAFSPGGYRTRMRGSSVSAAVTSGFCALGKAVNPGLDRERFLALAAPDDIPVNNRPKRQVNLKL